VALAGRAGTLTKKHDNPQEGLREGNMDMWMTGQIQILTRKEVYIDREMTLRLKLLPLLKSLLKLQPGLLVLPTSK
jgi:hypothetical protein